LSTQVKRSDISEYEKNNSGVLVSDEEVLGNLETLRYRSTVTNADNDTEGKINALIMNAIGNNNAEAAKKAVIEQYLLEEKKKRAEKKASKAASTTARNTGRDTAKNDSTVSKKKSVKKKSEQNISSESEIDEQDDMNIEALDSEFNHDMNVDAFYSELHHDSDISKTDTDNYWVAENHIINFHQKILLMQINI
jgi:hypothetical protein